jgi:hypothetical protein
MHGGCYRKGLQQCSDFKFVQHGILVDFSSCFKFSTDEQQTSHPDVHTKVPKEEGSSSPAGALLSP